MLAQLVGAGALIQLLFDIPYSISVILVGIMMTIYVLFGGMTATSWVQMVKAVLLMIGTLIISFLVLLNFNFNIFTMFGEMKKGEFSNPWAVRYCRAAAHPHEILLSGASAFAHDIYGQVIKKGPKVVVPKVNLYESIR